LVYPPVINVQVDLGDTGGKDVTKVQTADNDDEPNFSDPLKYICQGYDPNAPHFDGGADASSED
jgi:hypothetical protein